MPAQTAKIHSPTTVMVGEALKLVALAILTIQPKQGTTELHLRRAAFNLSAALVSTTGDTINAVDD